MRIYTITCNNAYNYGAVLQAYALQEYLEDLGHQVEILNYMPPYLRKISKRYRGKPLLAYIRKILYYPDYQKSKKIFGRFQKEYLHTTEIVRNIKDIERITEHNALYFAGSDQIWNPYLENGWDDTYYLKIPKIRKVSYAASIGRSDLSNDYIAFLKQSLVNFEKISLREKYSTEQLAKVDVKSTYVVDPVYLLSETQWNKLAHKKYNERYIIVYALHHINEIYIYASKLAKLMDAKVYVINVEIKEIRRSHDRFIWNPSVNDFLSLIRDSMAVVSNSFHGISFGLIFKRPVHIFDTELNDIRISNLVEVFGLEKNLVTDCNVILEDNTYTSDMNELIAKNVNNSKNFIASCLNNG